jgi:hypothetical protein
MAKKKQMTRAEQRNIRVQQVMFLVISGIVLLAMVLSLIR